ncbi:MAG: hypothetical protein TREMPRED_004529, partial [Tremellales sp. Tagirdzhanova-0007]
MQSITSALIGTTLALTVFVWMKIRNKKRHELHPVIGHLHEFAGRTAIDPKDYFELEATRANGWQPWRVTVLGAFDGWFITDSASLKYILVTKHKDFAKPERFTDCAVDILGAAFLNTRHHYPNERRKVNQSLLSPKTLAYIADKSFPRLLPALFDPLDAAAKSGEVIDFQVIGDKFVFLHFAHIAFAADEQNLEAFSEAFDRSLSQLYRRFMNPFYPILEAVLPY